MKKFNAILVSLLTIVALFTTSCKKDNENVDDSNQVHESAAVKSVINSLRTGPSQSNSGGQVSQNQVNSAINSYFCFDFVYPISVLYNDGSVQSIANDSEFAQAIAILDINHYIIDFVYPFDIILNGNTVTINNENDFITAINSCMTFTPFSLPQIMCFDFVYPVSVEMSDGSVVTVNNLQEFENLFTLTNVYPVDMVYPFDVVQNGTTQTISNAVEFQALMDSCYGNLVYCSMLPPSDIFTGCLDIVYPVTLVYNDGSTLVVNDNTEYDNAVFNSTPSHYAVDFQYDIEIIVNGTTVVIHDFTEFFDQVAYCITGNNNFLGDLLYTSLPLSSVFAGCFTINYPVTLVLSDGSTVTVNNDAEYDMQLLNSTQNLYVEDFQYPFTVTQNGNTVTVNDRSDFDNLIGNCISIN